MINRLIDNIKEMNEEAEKIVVLNQRPPNLVRIVFEDGTYETFSTLDLIKSMDAIGLKPHTNNVTAMAVLRATMKMFEYDKNSIGFIIQKSEYYTAEEFADETGIAFPVSETIVDSAIGSGVVNKQYLRGVTMVHYLRFAPPFNETYGAVLTCLHNGSEKIVESSMKWDAANNLEVTHGRCIIELAQDAHKMVKLSKFVDGRWRQK